MELHGNARLTPRGRMLMCERVRLDGWTVQEAAEAAGCSERTCYRWLARYDAGEAMTDRSSAPKHVPGRTMPAVEEMIERLRRLRWTSTRIAGELGLPTSTVCAVLARLGLNRLSRLDPPEPPNRYCRRHPGELIHVDVKKLGRFRQPGHRVRRRGPGTHRNTGVGWEYVHVAVDDTSRLAYVEVLENEQKATCIGFLRRALTWFSAHGVIVQRVMTDNGSAYRSRSHAQAVTELGLTHIRTRPYRPRTNGKAERFIQTLLREWAYAAAYTDSQHRRHVLRTWLRYYNCRRPHSALGHKPPARCLQADERS
jgi:transposase InsO family protein